MKKSCKICGKDISIQNIKRHEKTCDGTGPRRSKDRVGDRASWCRGKKYDEIFGKERGDTIRRKIGKKAKGNSGIAKTERAEKERRKKIAISMKGNGNGATSFRRKKIEYKGIIFKSKWEANTARFFDINGINWKYEDKLYDLSETTSYRPDFSLYENGIFIKHIEVKGYFRKENKEKFDKFRNMYPDVNIEVWGKKKLLELDIPTQ
jgi:hypothetical protein